LLEPSNHQSFYFNHSFTYQGADKYQIAIAQHNQAVAAVIRHDNIAGIQFHPEKSQVAGKQLLRNLITGLVNAKETIDRSCHN
jgi:glutamine amidotransferase